MATFAPPAAADLPMLEQEETGVEWPARISADEYFRMCDAGVFGDDHVELVRGELVRMAPSGLEHGSGHGSVFAALASAYSGTRYRMVIDVYLRLGEMSSRAPDISVVRGEVAGKALAPGNILLAVEISDTSRNYDLKAKAADYARAGIPHYWVVDVTQRETHVMGAPADGAYTQTQIVAFADALALPDSERTITLAD